MKMTMDDVTLLLNAQLDLASEIQRSYRNYNKDGSSRRAEPYVVKKFEGMKDLQARFEDNHAKVLSSNLPSNDDYFTNAERTRKQIEIALEAYSNALISLRSNKPENSNDNPRSPTTTENPYHDSGNELIEDKDEKIGGAMKSQVPSYKRAVDGDVSSLKLSEYQFPPLFSDSFDQSRTGTMKKNLNGQQANDKPAKNKKKELTDDSKRVNVNKKVSIQHQNAENGGRRRNRNPPSPSPPPSSPGSSVNEDGSDGETELIRNEWMRFINQIHKRTNVNLLTSKVLLEQTYSYLLKLQNELEKRFNNLVRNRMRWATMQTEYEMATNVLDAALTIISEKLENMTSENKTNIKLPRLSLKQFNGSIREFRPFIQLFDKLIHENKDIANIEKMQYLMSHVSGEAKDAIQHLNLTGENYNTAYTILCDKYMNHRKLVVAEVKTLLNLPINDRGILEGLKQIFNVVKDALEALKNLNIDISNWDPVINGMVLPYLDNESLQLFEQCLEAPKEVPSIDQILYFIEWRIDTLTHREKSMNSQVHRSYEK